MGRQQLEANWGVLCANYKMQVRSWYPADSLYVLLFAQPPFPGLAAVLTLPVMPRSLQAVGHGAGVQEAILSAFAPVHAQRVTRTVTGVSE